MVAFDCRIIYMGGSFCLFVRSRVVSIGAAKGLSIGAALIAAVTVGEAPLRCRATFHTPGASTARMANIEFGRSCCDLATDHTDADDKAKLREELFVFCHHQCYLTKPSIAHGGMPCECLLGRRYNVTKISTTDRTRARNRNAKDTETKPVTML